jgi:uncharacterized protein YjbI with pentapeptide repeats
MRAGCNAVADTKIDPFDISALEKSLNDSATRVSTIWLSFVAFSAYLAAAASTITHRQLLLNETIKLPTVNIDLPLFGSALLLPTLYVVFHVYVLLQVLLLSRTAAAYNAVVERVHLPQLEDTLLRQRLANTLFAQIFSGSPRERSGWLGWLLRSIVWTTLAIGPILILLLFQFMFLPYHSHAATWTHRFLILVELVAFFSLWPLALDGQQEIKWSRIQKTFKQITTLPFRLFGPKVQRRYAWRSVRRHSVLLVSCLLFVILPVSLATFPGEPHINLFTMQPPSSVHCGRWFVQKFDRLHLRQIDVVDDDRLKKIEEVIAAIDEPLFQGERTRNFQGRDFNCADFSGYADLRRVDLTGAQLRGANLNRAKLQGAFLQGAQLQGASLSAARLQGAFIDSAKFQGANLFAARLQGASLQSAELHGASLNGARLQGASLYGARLQGASLYGARLQGAELHSAQLHGASLDNAKLQGASLYDAELQGASFEDAELNDAVLSKAYVWRAKKAACGTARVADPDSEAKISSYSESVPITRDEIMGFIEYSTSGIPPGDMKKKATDRMLAGLIAESPEDDPVAIASVWSTCKEGSKSISSQEFDQQYARVLRDIACDATENRKAVADGLIEFRTSVGGSEFSTLLARGLLGRDGRECGATKDLDEKTTRKLISYLPPPERVPALQSVPFDE